MKKIICSHVFCFIFLFISAQSSEVCPSFLLTPNDENYHINVRFYNWQSTSISQATAEDAILRLNDALNPHGIFVYWDCKFYQESSAVFPLSEAIKIVINATRDNPLANYGLELVEISPVDINSTEFIHAMGHVFGLLDTGNPTQFPAGTSGWNFHQTPIDWADGNTPSIDCEIEGDCVCDTRPDHGSNLFWGNGNYNPGDLENQASYDMSNCLDNGNVSHNGFDYNVPIRNFMSQYPNEYPCRTKFTPGQGTRMRNYIQSIHSNRLALVDTDGNLDLDSGETIVQTITVNSGEQMSLGAGVFNFINGSSIVVNEGGKLLIVGAATLTTTCDNYWNGITLNGGEVEIYGTDNVIEFAEIGIEAKNGAVVDMMDFSMTLFKNNKINAIRGIDADKIMLNNVHFDDCEQAIILTFPSGNISNPGDMMVDNCTFTNNAEDLKVVSASGLNHVQVSNNSFSGLIGVNMNGDNSFDIRRNTFGSQSIWSTLLYSSGVAIDNSQSENDIASQNYGIVAVQDNTMYQFFANCFLGNGINDVIVAGKLSDQGTQSLASANCFTQDAISDIAAYTNGNPFNYWEPDLNLNFNQCVFSTTNTPNGYKVEPNAAAGTPSGCNIQGGNSSGGGTNSSLCEVNNNPTDINNEIANIHSLIANINQIQFSSQAARDSELAALNRCLKKLYNQLADYYFENNLISDAVNVYSSHPLFEMQIKAYFILVQDGQYINARSYLNGLSTQTTEQAEFKQSSLIYLDAIEQGSSYALSSNDENLIYQAALKSSPLAGYSRSIWMYFKGEDIRMNVTLPNGQTAPRSKSISQTISSIVYPNPASVELIIQVEGLKDQSFGFELTNLMGKAVTRKINLQYEYRLDVSNFSAGLYLCRVMDDQGQLIKLHKVYIQ